MFRINTNKFGTQTSYDKSLSGYTVELNKEQTTQEQVLIIPYYKTHLFFDKIKKNHFVLKIKNLIIDEKF